MDSIILVASITALITIIGWLANHILQSARERHSQRLRTSINFIERQLEELYGPLAFLVLEGKRTFKDLLETLGRDFVFYTDEWGERSLPEDELKLWQFWVENDLISRNEKIKELLMKKTHLIDGKKIPNSYLEFLDHHNSWMINHLRWKKEGIEYSWHSKINWPKNFGKDVLSTFEKLKERHSLFLKEISVGSNK